MTQGIYILRRPWAVLISIFLSSSTLSLSHLSIRVLVGTGDNNAGSLRVQLCTSIIFAICCSTYLRLLRTLSSTCCDKLNIQKCKAVSYGRKVNKDYKYHMLQEGTKMIVQRDDHIKDLGVTFNEKLDFGLHVAEKVNKAYSMLWLIKRNFKDIGAEAFVIGLLTINRLID